MIRIILLFLLFIFCFLSLGFALDYEVIRNYDDHNQLVTVYLDKEEVLSVIGEDFLAYRRAYSFISKLILYNQLNYDPNKIQLVKMTGNQYKLSWDDAVIARLTPAEKKLNDSRGNSVVNLKRIAKFNGFLSNYGKKIAIPLFRDKARSIRKLKTIDIADNAYKSKYFPAVHPSLPLGTKIRITNLNNNWSVVVEVIKNIEVGSASTIGIDNLVSDALRLDDNQRIKIQVL